jgi:hypothetical protein
MQNVHASQTATDYLNKFKFLSDGFPNMHMKYDTLRAGCVSAAWIAKNPAVQQFVQNNFNMIAGTAGCIFTGIVGFALRSLYRWRNDKNYDKQFNADPVFRKNAFKAALNAGLLQWTHEHDKQDLENAIPLHVEGRYGPVGGIVLKGEQAAFAGSGYRAKAILFNPENVLRFRLLNKINQKGYACELHKSAAISNSSEGHAVSSGERNLVISDEFNTHNPARTPLVLLSDDQYRVQLVDLLADYLERLPDNRMGPVDLLVSEPMQTIDISNEVPTTSTQARLTLVGGEGMKVIHPEIQGWGVGMTAISTPKVLKALAPHDASYLVAQDGAFKQRVSVEIKDESRFERANELDVPRSAKITLDLGGTRPRECVVFNADKAQVVADWDVIKDIIIDECLWEKPAKECLKLTRAENGYVFGQPEVKPTVVPEPIFVPIIFGRPDAAASSSNAGSSAPRGRVHEFTSTLPKNRKSMSPTRSQRQVAALKYQEAPVK